MLSKFELRLDFPRLNQHYFSSAQAALKQQQYTEAACLLLYLCQIYPHFENAKFQLAQAQMQFQYWEGARKHLEELSDKRDPDIICNLGICHWQQGQIKQALRHFKYNLIHFPHHLETRENLASLYLQFHRIPKAIGHYQDILNLQTHRFEIRFNLAACFQKQGHYQAAVYEYRQILQDHPQHYPSLYNLGVICYNLKELKAAKHYWTQCLSLKPNHRELLYLLKHLSQEAFSWTEYQEYVKHNFDHYAMTYNQHLNQTLNYRLPYHLDCYAKTQFQPQQFAHSLDLGCGTGLCGPWLKIYSKHLTGVDFSAPMLAKAEQLKIYDRLAQASIDTFFEDSSQKFDCIILVDVVPYINELGELVAKLKPHLSPGAHLLFTTEISSQYPSALQIHSRFAYHPEYVQKCCQELGLKLINEFDVRARDENQMPVLTGIYHWQMD